MISSLYWNLLFLFDRYSFCLLFNFLEVFKRQKKKRKCFYDSTSQSYFLREEGNSIYFSRKLRLFRLLDGVLNRIEKLYFAYTGGHVSLSPGDIVIDCGANIGEFSLYCHLRGASVFAFEPDPIEFRALKANAKNKFIAKEYALWKNSHGVDFYLANDTGDSGIFSPGNAGSSAPVRVKTISLNEFISKRISSSSLPCPVKLLKLEAEGAEIEIIEGALEVLSRIQYIAADLGPERGGDCESTLPEVVNILTGCGFKLLHYMPSRSIVLFENQARSFAA